MTKYQEQTTPISVTFSNVHISPKDPDNPLKGNSIIVDADKSVLLTRIQPELITPLLSELRVAQPQGDTQEGVCPA